MGFVLAAIVCALCTAPEDDDAAERCGGGRNDPLSCDGAASTGLLAGSGGVSVPSESMIPVMIGNAPVLLDELKLLRLDSELDAAPESLVGNAGGESDKAPPMCGFAGTTGTGVDPMS